MPGVEDVLDGRGVLGNKGAVGSVNANRTYFERGVLDMALAEAHYPGWLGRLFVEVNGRP